MEQRQAQRVVRRLVPTVFAVVENRHAVAAVGIRQIDPFLGRHFIGRFGVVAALDEAQPEVVSRLRVGHGTREFGFQQHVAARPVDRVAHVDAVVVAAVGQRHVLHELRGAVAALHFERGAHGPLFGDRNAHVAVDRTPGLVHRLLHDLPRRIAVRRVALEDRHAECLALGHQLAAGMLVADRADIAVGVQLDAVDPVFERPLRRFQRRRFRNARSGAHVVDGISRRLDVGGEEDARPVALARQNLRRHPPARRRIDGHPLGTGVERHFGLHQIAQVVGHGIVDHHGRTLHPRVERMAQRTDGRRHDLGSLLQRDQFVVPRITVGVGDARTRQVVVELMPQHALPHFVELRTVVGFRAQPVGRHSGALGGAQQLLVAAVVVLHRSLRGVAAAGMYVHEQFAVVGRQLVAAIHIIEEELVARGADELHRRIEVGHGLGHAARGGHRAAVALVAAVGRAVQVAAAVIAHGRIVEAVRSAADEILVIPRVGRQFGGIPARIEGRHERLPVDTVPYAPREGVFLVIGCVGEEVVLAPAQLLGRETDQAAVGRQRRQRVPEPEAVGQEDVGRTHAELALVELLSLQDVADERLGRRHVGVVGIPRRAADVPAPLVDILLQTGVVQRIVLLHPSVDDAALEIELVIGIPLQHPEVLEEDARNVFPDGVGQVPVPLGVEMRVAHRIDLVGLGCGRLLLLRRGTSGAERQDARDDKQSKKFHRSKKIRLIVSLHSSIGKIRE